MSHQDPFTKESVITWAANCHQYGNTVEGLPSNRAFQAEKYEKLNIMTDQGKTKHQIHYQASELVAHRPFLDQAAAQEYIDFMQQLSAKYGLTISSAEIVDFVEENYYESYLHPNYPTTDPFYIPPGVTPPTNP